MKMIFKTIKVIRFMIGFGFLMLGATIMPKKLSQQLLLEFVKEVDKKIKEGEIDENK